MRRLAIIILIGLALAGGALAIVCRTQQLAFHSVHRPNAQQGLRWEDLVVVKNAPPPAPTYITSIPKLGYVLDVLQKPGGIIAAVYLPATLGIIYELKRLSKHYRNPGTHQQNSYNEAQYARSIMEL